MKVTWEVAADCADHVNEEILAESEPDQHSDGRGDPSAARGSLSAAITDGRRELEMLTLTKRVVGRSDEILAAIG